ncbi:MAG: hypothetical protein JRE40_00350 [Deltaproteobacteria bacterium]|nr:hypothetical protein [Deltaproteobacteria bacterium]
MTWINRTLCDVLDELRKCYKTHNYSYMLGLIEEAQSMGNRMEAAIGDLNDIESNREESAKLKKACKALRKEKRALRDDLGKPKPEWEDD